MGLIYGSGSDLASVKRSILGVANENARNLTGGGNDGWGPGSGY
ncbi:hypothetical protein [Qipengyuania qiaonensis]|nr:hypothetical protein [Qipengyuania qiaonensis]